MFPGFIWRNTNSADLGVRITEYPPIVRPKERVTQITVPGRQGILTLPEAEQPVYESYLKNVKCWIGPGANREQVISWLQGSGQLVMGNEPDRVYRARIINQIDFEQLLKRKEYREFTVPFLCEPLKGQYPEEDTIEITASGSSIFNPGNVPAYPVITLYGSGNIMLVTGGGAVSLASISEGIILDWDAQECTSLDQGTLLNSKVTGDPQSLPVGNSLVTWTGSVSRLLIKPNWRWL